MKDRAKPLPEDRPLSQVEVLIVAEYIYNVRHQISSDELEQAIQVVRDAHKGKHPGKTRPPIS